MIDLAKRLVPILAIPAILLGGVATQHQGSFVKLSERTVEGIRTKDGHCVWSSRELLTKEERQLERRVRKSVRECTFKVQIGYHRNGPFDPRRRSSDPAPTGQVTTVVAGQDWRAALSR
jgi:hypothetical protein